jgi:anti-sigma factor ChrR (cupin superfamily)
MMTCKQVSTLMSTGALEDAPLRTRLAVRLHLSMCDKCSAFKRWLEAIGRAAKSANQARDVGAPPDLETRVIRRIERLGR